MKTWKKAEQRAAAKFGTKRAPLSGSNGGVTASDTLSPNIFAEVKYRKKHWAVSLFHDVEEAARNESSNSGPGTEYKLPVVVLVERGRRRLFVVAPLEPGYLQVLANELKRHEAKEGDGTAGNRVECTNFIDAPRWSELFRGEHKP